MGGGNPSSTKRKRSASSASTHPAKKPRVVPPVLRRSVRPGTLQDHLRIQLNREIEDRRATSLNPNSRSSDIGYDLLFLSDSGVFSPPVAPSILDESAVLALFGKHVMPISPAGMHHLQLNCSMIDTNNGLYVSDSASGTILCDKWGAEGKEPSGLGLCYERLHLIGRSAGGLDRRRYLSNNIRIGSHALNTAMIPFEGLVKESRTKYLDVVYDVIFHGQNNIRFDTFVKPLREVVFIIYQKISFSLKCCGKACVLDQLIYDPVFHLECEKSIGSPIKCHKFFARDSLERREGLPLINHEYKISRKNIETIKKAVKDFKSKILCGCVGVD